MGDYKKFKDMTKPLKFRPIRRVWNTIRNVISNNYYNILYKLNIIDYISNEDEIPRHCATLKSSEGYIVANKVMCDVVVRVTEIRHISDSYYKTKKGRIIPVHHDEYAVLKFTGMLSNLAFNFNDLGYRSVTFDNKIRYKECPETSLEPYDPDKLLEKLKVVSVEVDLSEVSNLRIERTLMGYYSDVQNFMFDTIYKMCVRELEEYIRNINWEEHTTRRTE